MKAYTEGEWIYHDYSNSVIIKDSGSRGAGYPPEEGTIASLNDDEYICNYNKYDGYLIAAAPDLFEALEELLRVFEIYEDGCFDGIPEGDAPFIAARSALKKARGE